ncbi:YqhA family protein, partial [Rhizobium ruizarguesonis]
DAALVVSLIVMVVISGYENFFSRFDEASEADSEVSFLGKLDAGSLKIKVASSSVAISSIHLLQVFLNADKDADGKIM